MRYLNLHELVAHIDNPEPYRGILLVHRILIGTAQGSSHNHQAWEGGYRDHVTETMNIAFWLYVTSPRLFPFSLSDALEVMFLHDIEKPFATQLKAAGKYTKADRKQYRADFIREHGIVLSPEQENALQYVEGVPDSEYTPGERTMNELAGFCHCCDILSARVWHDRGHEHGWDEHGVAGV
jgi:hypothetical protein